MNLLKILAGGVIAAVLAIGSAQAGQDYNNNDNNFNYNDCSHDNNGCTPLHLSGTATNGALTVWNFRCVGGLGALCADALPSNPGASGTPLYSGLYTGAVNFQMPAVFDSVGAFLATGGGSFNSPLTFGDYATVLSTGFTHNVGIVTLMEFTFTLTGTDLLKIQHDDGISIWNSTDTHNYLPTSASDPTTLATTTITLLAGTYNLWYAEVNGLPADLLTCITPVPEPLTLSLFGAGLAGAAAMRRRKKKSA